MNRRSALSLCLAVVTGSLSGVSLAQPKARTWRVGIVWGGSPATIKVSEDAFMAGMKEHGYEVGRNLVVHSRYSEGNPSRYRGLIDEVLAAKPDALLAANTGVAILMKERTATIPIVLGTSADPVGDGLVQSLARPGGNVTGISLQLAGISGKHIELLSELLPGMRRVGLLLDLSQPKTQLEQYERHARVAATAKELRLEVVPIDRAEQIRGVLDSLRGRGTEALVIGLSPRFNALRRQIAQHANEVRLPAIGFSDEYTEEGGLISYSPSFVLAIRRTAYFMHRIFQGAKAGDLPIEQPTVFSLVVNANTATSLGLKIPQAILLRADRVIE
ncbi:MAG TPA: ABC transporter substrate-binding protein [Burkholderiales bacterium]|nr:ABC transporter substrate-binding protein [Burkholderiales bacterium]